ncbi:MAG TPA: EamA family transporter [Ktedonobacterales bacterium]|nr:EamA family transporter [Ktedonobacterales bacterium]
MPPLALALVLLAALFHAGWNLLLHGTDDRLAAATVAGLAAGIGLIPAMVIAPPWQVWPLIILSALAECAYALCLTTAYRMGALSLVYPLARGAAPLLVTLGGWLLLSQAPTPWGFAGAAALALGLASVATAGKHSGQRAAIGFALLTGVCIATYATIDAGAVRQVNPLSYLGAVIGLQGILLAVILRLDLKRLRRAMWPGIQIAIGSTAAYLLVLLAFQRANAGPVATLREVSVLIGVLLARERKGWHVWLGAALVALGAILTAL